MPKTNTLTPERLREVVTYSPETGIFTWNSRRGVRPCTNAMLLGKTVGTKYADGNTEYLAFTIDGKRYRAHRLAWLYITSEWPERIDHINGIGDDNRFSNLRSVPNSGNSKNQALRSGSRTGVSGVHLVPRRKKYRVLIQKDGKDYFGGSFTDLGEAAESAKKLYKKLGFHPNHGLTREQRSIYQPE